MKTTILNFILLLFIFENYAQTYNSAESVEYDANNSRWLVSNGNRIIIDDGNGNLSYFGNGSATHGMEVMNNTLFAVDGSDIVGYDLTSENEIMRFTIPGALFLNGLANNGSDTLYITDFSAKKISRLNVSDLNNPVFTELISNTTTTPNGIFFDGENDRLIYVSWSGNAQIRGVNLSTNVITVLTTTNLGNIDGIVKDNDGNFYVSSWSPNRITKFNNDFSTFSTVTTPSLNSPADIGYDVSNNIIGIPMGNNVIFVASNPLGTDDIEIDLTTIKISNNPVNNDSSIIFDIKKNSFVNLELLDSNGKVVSQLINNKQLFGKKEIPLNKLNLTSGVYIVKLRINNEVYSEKIIVK